jgi:hypothetical protein
MIRWKNQPLKNLSRSDVESAAAEAIDELLDLREINERRQRHDRMVLSFLLGASCAAAAAAVGLLLH